MAPAKHLLPMRARLAAVIAIGAAAALASPPAAAQTSDELTHLRQVFAEGRALEGKGQWADALKKFEVVAGAKMTPQVRFHIALCEENLGKLVSAMKGFDLAAEEAKEAGSSAAEVAASAPPRAEALRGRIAKLQIDVNGKLVTSKIVLDDATVAAKDLGAQLPMDPGAHVIEVRDAAGKSTFRKDLTLAEKGSERVEVRVDDREATPEPGGGGPPPPPPSRVPVIVAGVAGAAALAVSGVFFVLRSSNISTIAQHCKDPVTFMGCRPGDQDLASQGKLYTGLADTFLGVGLAGIGTAGVLAIVIATRKQPAGPPAKAAGVSVLRIVPAGTGFKVMGAF